MFAPNATITRAEFTSLLVRALGLSSADETSSIYSDISSKDWFYNDVLLALKEGLITKSSDGNFNPNQPITREQMAVMVVRAAKAAGKQIDSSLSVETTLSIFADQNQIKAYSRQAVAEAVSSGLIQGVTVKSFVPDAAATRAQAATILKRFLQLVDFIN